MTKTKRIEFTNPIVQDVGTLTVQIESTAPLMMNQFSAKAQQAILDKQVQQKVKVPRKAKDVVADCLNSLHIIGKRPTTMAEIKKAKLGFPAVAFKAGMIRAATLSDSKMVETRMLVFVEPDPSDVNGELIEIVPTTPVEMDQRPVRLQGTTMDIRSRAVVPTWKATLNITFLARRVTPQQVLAWLATAGYSVGLGEGRPLGKSSTGMLGRFKVVKAVAEVPEFEDAKAVTTAKTPAKNGRKPASRLPTRDALPAGR